MSKKRLRERIPYLLVLGAIIIFISCSQAESNEHIVGKWAVAGGHEIMIFKPGRIVQAEIGKRIAWKGNYKSIGENKFEIKTGVVGVYAKPMVAEIDASGKVIILKKSENGKQIARYTKM